MWVKKEVIKDLNAKIRRLEDAVARLECDTQLWKADPPEYAGVPVYGYVSSKSISVGNFRGADHILLVDIVKLLLDKLGYELKKTPQVKQGIKLVKK